MFSLRVDDEIELGLYEERHAQALFELTDRSREHIREWLPWVDGSTTVEASRNFIKISLKQYAENDGLAVGIWYKGELAGTASFHYFDWHTRRTEIGYWLGQEFTGKGLMTRAVRRLVEYGFDELNLNRIEIRCAPGNRKSRAIPERLGFTAEGTLRQVGFIHDNILVDMVVYGLLKDEWAANPK
ncbi:MAG: GNAT family N-acetyltransferase [Chloroflexi bacterium]|mgnify:CR=1 FL=1|nr:GNAT family N-acetyltransferase [Chloroflexota bacterium]OJV95196.1 MAG: alanine acetyltransferase [Chloroflexi bacterium 54-19]